jgi:hypothetical protein
MSYDITIMTHIFLSAKFKFDNKLITNYLMLYFEFKIETN